MPQWVKYQTIIHDLRAVGLRGVLRYDAANGGYIIEAPQPIGESRIDNVEAWLEKFDGHLVELTISRLDNSKDDAKLLGSLRDTEEKP